MVVCDVMSLVSRGKSGTTAELTIGEQDICGGRTFRRIFIRLQFADNKVSKVPLQ